MKLPKTLKGFAGPPEYVRITDENGVEQARVYRGDNTKRAEAIATAIEERWNVHDELVNALNGLFEHCTMVHRHWGEGCNQKEATAAIEAAQAAVAKAEGKQ